MSNTWFDVDKDGLRKLIEHKGKSFIVFELIQNAWDAPSSKVQVSLESIENSRGRVKLVVTDDNPTGFENIKHAYTLYAESSKKNDVRKRGRFNLGEKLVLALCDEAEIISVKNAVKFDLNGFRRTTQNRTQTGSRFEAILRLTKNEIIEVNERVQTLIPPPGVLTTYNGMALKTRVPKSVFKSTLPTVTSDTEGILRLSTRITEVEIYIPELGETPMLYEMGIPVVESNMSFHVNVAQKIPLNQDRDNVTPSYFRAICREVLNNTYDFVSEETTTDTWIKTAMEDKEVHPEAFLGIFKKRFGEKVVSYDPSDVEANNRAVANGYTVLHGRQLSATAWDNARTFEAVKPAGSKFATPKPFYENGEPVEVIPRSEWTSGMHSLVEFIKNVAREIANQEVETVIVKELSGKNLAACGPDCVFYISLKMAKNAFFEIWEQQGFASTCALIIHELAHIKASNHLSENFYKELTRLGGRMTQLALKKPELFPK